MYIYKMFGMIISSEIQLPVCQEQQHLAGQATVFIKYGKVHKHLPNDIRNADQHTFVKPGNIWLHIKDVVWIHIFNGTNITVELFDNADLQTVCLFLFGSGIGALAHQQGKSIIHGNTIQTKNGCIVFTGDSGAGKSTISTAMYTRGHSFVADDLAVITTDFEVEPGIPRLKIWQDTAQKLNINTENLDKIRLLVDKYSYPITKNISFESKPIQAIILLENHNDNTFNIEEVKGIEKLAEIQKHTYRRFYVEGMGYHQQFFELTSNLSQRIILYRITRPANDFGFQLEKLINIVDDIITTNYY